MVSGPQPIVVIGGGIAGIWLAINLLERHEHVVLFDLPKKNTPSRIGAGVINPITGKRAAKTWEVDTFLKHLLLSFESRCFRPIKHLLQPLSLYRPFKTPFEANEWAGKSADENFSKYVNYQHISKKIPALLDPFGGINIQGYRLQVEAFLQQIIPILLETERFTYINKPLLKSQLFLETNEFEFEGERRSYRYAVNCVGCDILDDTSWPSGCVVPLKGQLGNGTIIPSVDLAFGLSRAIFVLQEKEQFLIGSTYELEFDNEDVTEKSTQDLLAKAQELLQIDQINWSNQRAGLRATTFDRKPLIGRHLQHERYFLLNGLGTKGVLIASLAAKILTDNMLKNIPIPKELNWTRLLHKKRA